MPTPVSVARQCLTPDSARALDEAVGVSRRRNHAQTTSLHAVSALLAFPSSVLRDACVRARSSAYSPRLQFKALELCFGVALDRLPSSQSVDEPPISNSLMAAIKRSQASQRRHPENYHLYQQQQQQQQSSSLSCVKVELQQLILSILDDPVVSRVFGEAGFRSCDIKLAIVRPPPPPLRYTRSRCPPLFLCNLTGSDSESGRRSFSFPFSGFSGFSGISDGDKNCMRIGEVLARKKGRNPMLIGVFANEAVRSFVECVETGKGTILPAEITGLKFINIEKEISEFIVKNRSDGSLGLRFEELGQSAESCSDPGVVVYFGDLKGFIGDGWLDAVAYVVAQLTRLLELHCGNLWLMGAAESYETYLKFLNRYPSIEKDWDLQLLPITSLRPSTASVYPRPYSLMESFVPFGGFFSAPSDLKGPLNSTYQFVSRCHLCNEKYEQEVSAILKGECTVSVADRYQGSLPSWLQTADLSSDTTLDAAKAKDDCTVLNAKVMGLKRKWNDICQHLHRICPVPETDIYEVGSQGLPGSVELSSLSNRKDRANDNNRNSIIASPNGSGCKNVYCSMSMDSQKISSPKQNTPIPVVPKAKNVNFLSELQLIPSQSEQHEKEGLLSSPYTRFNLSMPDDRASPSSATSVMTDLGLGTLYEVTCKELQKPISHAYKESLDSSNGFPDEVDGVDGNISTPTARTSSCCGPDTCEQFDSRNFKMLWRGLTEKVGRQEAAICAISQTVAHCRTENGRRRGASLKGDIWLSFLGPDRVAKKRITMALAEFCSRENLISVNLNFQDGTIRSNAIFDCQEINGYEMKFRGMTVVDYIAGELSRKPLSVVFLENVEKADLLVQNSLSQAIRTGKFSDSHGREININNAIFVTTSRFTRRGKTFFHGMEPANFSEERIVGARGWQMQILIGTVPEDTSMGNNSNVSVVSRKDKSASLCMNRQKLIGTGDPKEQCKTLESDKRVHKAANTMLDLNLPAEEVEVNDTDNENCDSDSISENSEAWMEDFLDQVDEVVVFKPFDFDSLANTILKEISKSFQKIIGSEGRLEIDSEVMEQILAAAWLSDRKRAVEDWVEQVLSKSFADSQQMYGRKALSVLKLVTCEGLLMEKQAPGVYLPSRIILN